MASRIFARVGDISLPAFLSFEFWSCGVYRPISLHAPQLVSQKFLIIFDHKSPFDSKKLKKLVYKTQRINQLRCVSARQFRQSSRNLAGLELEEIVISS